MAAGVDEAPQADFADLWGTDSPKRADGASCASCGQQEGWPNRPPYCWFRMMEQDPDYWCGEWVPKGTPGCRRWAPGRGFYKTGDEPDDK